VKRVALVSHLNLHGCLLVREGANHSIWKNPANQKIQALPRHREIKKFTAKGICQKLNIPIPAGL